MNKDEKELALLIVETLGLDFDVATADSRTPLYKDGFGLDSIDILEIALAISQNYDVKLRADDEENTLIFSSLGSLSAFIQEHRTS